MVVGQGHLYNKKSDLHILCLIFESFAKFEINLGFSHMKDKTTCKMVLCEASGQ